MDYNDIYIYIIYIIYIILYYRIKYYNLILYLNLTSLLQTIINRFKFYYFTYRAKYKPATSYKTVY